MFAHVTLLLLVLQQLVANTEQGLGCGCPDGWVYFRDSCYLFADKTRLDWTEAGVKRHANKECLMLKKHCPLINTPDHSQSFWTAGSDGDIEGIWEWYPDNTPFTYTNWYPGQPDSNHGNEDCLSLYNYQGFTWHDDGCDYHRHALCELRLTVQPGSIIGK